MRRAVAALRSLAPIQIGLLSLALLTALGLASLPGSQARAGADQGSSRGALAQPAQPIVGNDTCLECHSDQTLGMSLEDGTLVSLYIDPDVFHGSVHGSEGYACVQCHTNLGEYPHPTFTAADRRDLSLQLYQACQRCHPSQYALTLDSVHDRARAEGVREAAICTDCHGAHDTRRLTDPQTHQLTLDARPWIPQTCSKCHSAIFQEYLTSVHGSALFDESNPDVPTCIDCHGVHNIEDPTTAAFRLKSPQLCAKCHTNEQLMGKYGISTAVLSTYVSDFHGTTVTLFEKQSPDAETNKPVCFDCHGVHNIARPDDPQRGLEVRENLLARCQICHPNATANFPGAWLSHYIPSPQHARLVWLVDTFYKIFIPSVLGGMGALVVLDARWRFGWRLWPRRKPSETEAEPAADPPQTAPPTTKPPDDEPADE